MKYKKKNIIKVFFLQFFILMVQCKSIKNNEEFIGFNSNGIYSTYFLPNSNDMFIGLGNGRMFLLRDDSLNQFSLDDSLIFTTIMCSSDPTYLLTTCENRNIKIKKYDSIQLDEIYKLKSEQALKNAFDPRCSDTIDYTLSLDMDGKRISYKNNLNSYFIYAWIVDDIIYACDERGVLSKLKANGEVVSSFKLRDTQLNCVVQNQSNHELVVSASDGSIIIVRDTIVSHSFNAHKGAVYVAFYLPHSNEIISAGADGRVCKWILNKQGQYVLSKSIPAHKSVICAMHYNTSGTQIVTGGQDGWIRIWDAKTLSLIKEVDVRGIRKE